MAQQVFKLNKTTSIHSLFCGNRCQNSCHVHSVSLNKICETVSKRGIINCAATYALWQLKCMNDQPYIRNNELFVAAIVYVKNEECDILFVVDTGAQISCIAYETYLLNFHMVKLNPDNKTVIKGPSGNKLECVGYIQLQVVVTGILQSIQFYVLRDLQCNILGLQDIVKFQMQINFAELENNDVSENKHKIKRLGSCSDVEILSRVDDRQTKSREQPVPSNPRVSEIESDSEVVKFTLMDPKLSMGFGDVELKLVMADIKPNKYMGIRFLISNCDCLEGQEVKQLELCENCTVLYLSTPANYYGTIQIKYKADFKLIDKATPFYGIAKPTTALMEGLKEKANVRINKIRVQCPSIDYVQGGDIHFNLPQIDEGNIKLVPAPDNLKDTEFVEYQQFFNGNRCDSCKHANLQYCDFKENPACQEYIKLKTLIGLEKSETKCTVVEIKTDRTNFNDNLIIPVFGDSNNIDGVFRKCFPYTNKLDLKFEDEPSVTAFSNDGRYHFYITGIKACYIEIRDILSSIGALLVKHKINTISILNYEQMMLPTDMLKTLWCHFEITVYITINNNNNIKKMKLSKDQEMVLEQSDIDQKPLQERLNILIDDNEVKTKLYKIVEKYDIAKPPLQSIFPNRR